MRICLIHLLCLFFAGRVSAQESGIEKEKMYRHRVTVMMANSHIPNAENTDGHNKFSIVPTWGVDYDFWFNNKWAIGFHNDLVLQQYKIIKDGGQTELERSYPVGSCIVGIYKPIRNLALVTGIGKEFEKAENLNMWKIGVEYGFELPKAWELSLNLQYDNKFEAYDSWLFGIGISKLFH